ncbi:DUF4296 domain-containing protein [Antarcticibacterium arcticum]|uniref:DUF4296 domain-containing protein n=1 Tax=Antarcticibacterium arcticum TaxID=2585771 RepID=A0A5B8YRK3_9FLAO|nr:DUF4296 domain-containing protein [Antarcticibacterium arcticum]QED38749.1 DUF4296 domain-containing protein [Antarcticibacterium arcticum]
MKFVWVFAAAFLFFSCQNIEKVEKPKNLISEQKMAEVLTDLSLLNSAKNYNRRLLEETGLKPDEYLYTKHNIDSAQLSQSTRYYASDQNRLEAIYKNVKTNLEKLQRELAVKKENEERLKDTLPDSKKDSIIQDSLLGKPPRRDSLIMASPEYDIQ